MTKTADWYSLIIDCVWLVKYFRDACYVLSKYVPIIVFVGISFKFAVDAIIIAQF